MDKVRDMANKFWVGLTLIALHIAINVAHSFGVAFVDAFMDFSAVCGYVGLSAFVGLDFVERLMAAYFKLKEK